MKLDKYLKEDHTGEDLSKYKFSPNTTFSLEGNIRITRKQLQSIKIFTDKNFQKMRSGNNKDVIDFLTIIVNNNSHILNLVESFKDLRLNSEFPYDDGTQK